jgi:hypothetical protein
VADDWPSLLEVFDGALFAFFGTLAMVEVGIAMFRSSDKGEG